VDKILDSENRSSSIGIVIWRKCPLCGHHELGYTTRDGVFHLLKPGTPIQILEGSDFSRAAAEDEAPEKGFATQLDAGVSEYKVWTPDPVKGNKRLRLKYGVMVNETLLRKTISGDVYHLAYLEKLQRLIEKEMDTPLAVILDRFFTAPHLGVGNPRQIAEALWRELDEIKRPVILVSAWLEKQDEESLRRMIHPIEKEELADQPISEDQERAEQERLTLEAFLELL
jgi:hypothetical protein